jgi:hypothetical protein
MTKTLEASSDRLELSLRCADRGHKLGTRALSRAEIEARAVSQLPDREAMSPVNGNAPSRSAWQWP